MSIIDELLSTLPLSSPPRVGRTGGEVREVRIGAFWTAVVLEDGRCGLASALRDPVLSLSKGDDHHHPSTPRQARGDAGSGHRHGQNPVREAGHLHQRSALALAELARSDSLLEASIGLAAINALLDVDAEACVELNAEQVILDQIRSARSPDRSRVVVVGHFPFIPRVREAASQLWVLEKHPGQGDLPAEAASEVIPQADVVAITGTSLINHTFEELMGLCRPEAFVLVLGPTAPLSPVLFNYGVDVISGTLVTDPATVLRYVSQGASFRQIKRSKGVKLLTLAKEALQE